VVEPFDGTSWPKGDRTRGRVAYYEYGVVSLELELPFKGSWEDIIRLAASWMNDPSVEKNAAEAVREHIERAATALVNRYEQWLTEDYYVIQLNTIVDDRGIPVTADDLIEHCGDSIAQIVRGEPARFSEAERAEILESRMSYYDVLVVGWTAALIYDTLEGARSTRQLLEYANTQLLEFRHYDAVLTQLLAEVYQSLERGTGFFARWRLAREGGKAQYDFAWTSGS
jgi:hypothetical protein